LEVQTVSPVTEFEAQELTAAGVVIVARVIPVPSIGTNSTFALVLDQLPSGTYEATSVPFTSTDNELDGTHALTGSEVGVAVGVALPVEVAVAPVEVEVGEWTFL
jgi:hypothetical protein